MAYGSIPLDKRLKDNIRNYKLTTLYDEENTMELLKAINKVTGVDIMITERHGEKAFAVGEWSGFKVDVDNNTGVEVRICDRTVAHIFVKYDAVSADCLDMVKVIVDGLVDSFEKLGDKAYRLRELEIYVDELEAKVEKETYQVKNGDKTDELTDTLNRTYFENRLKIIDRSQVVPVAAVCFNINDWKYVNDRYGDEESDRLIAVIADIIRQESKADYVIGRVDGDVFNVIIPMPADDEAEEYVRRVQEACLTYEDPRIAPSLAAGLAIKENVETPLTDTLSDAEYSMFENKIEIKKSEGYRTRLTHGEE